MHGRLHGKTRKIRRDLVALCVTERFAKRTEPRLVHAAMRTSGSVMPRGSTVLFARAM